MDPVALAVLSAFGGAGLTAVAGFIGALLQSRREHDKWVREQRYNAYLAYVHADDRYTAVRREIEASNSAFEAVREWIVVQEASPGAPMDEPPELDVVGRTHEERSERLAALHARMEAAHEGIVEAAGAFSLLGPDAVVKAAHNVVGAKLQERNRAIADLEVVMRKALGVRN